LNGAEIMDYDQVNALVLVAEGVAPFTATTGAGGSERSMVQQGRAVIEATVYREDAQDRDNRRSSQTGGGRQGAGVNAGGSGQIAVGIGGTAGEDGGGWTNPPPGFGG
jgi:hypothetical protein